MAAADTSEKTEQTAPSNLEVLRLMWTQLPLRQKFHGFALILSFLALVTSIAQNVTLHVVLTASVFILLLLPIVADAWLHVLRREPKVTPEDGPELRVFCEKLKELEDKTKFLIKEFGATEVMRRKFTGLFPYDAPNAGGLVSRYSMKSEADAEKYLILMNEIIRQIVS